MSKAIEKIKAAITKGMEIRPKVGGFPYLAEVLRQAGITKNIWTLPACQTVYITNEGPAVMTMPSLINEMSAIPKFNQEALITALRTDQAGKSSFPEFLVGAWKAGVVRYEVDFIKRHVIYMGVKGEEYLEEYPAVEVK